MKAAATLVFIKVVIFTGQKIASFQSHCTKASFWRVVEIGRGNGSWLIDAAIQYPHCTVIGVENPTVLATLLLLPASSTTRRSNPLTWTPILYSYRFPDVPSM
ncbi:hypothetical protein BX666DRAFT_394723 [Dichotomocladium elegans]|nr:hypothetical protein BX666DRAFT_394723 [Dichotomocladium elegans]